MQKAAHFAVNGFCTYYLFPLQPAKAVVDVFENISNDWPEQHDDNCHHYGHHAKYKRVFNKPLCFFFRCEQHDFSPFLRIFHLSERSVEFLDVNFQNSQTNSVCLSELLSPHSIFLKENNVVDYKLLVFYLN